MRKTILPEPPAHPGVLPLERWLDIARIASVEVTSENPDFSIECALATETPTGWRAAVPGTQKVRLHLDAPQDLHRIHLNCIGHAEERTQEITIYAATTMLPLHELRRLQWIFLGVTAEKIEDFTLHLPAVTTLELRIDPDHGRMLEERNIYASPTGMKLA